MSSKHKTPATGLRLPPELVRAVDDWCAAQRPPVTRTAFVVTAVEDLLAAKTVVRATRSETQRKESSQ